MEIIGKEYVETYKQDYGELFQVIYRREKLLETLKKHPHKTILEIGTALEPLFVHFDDYEQMVIVEPAQYFIDIANEKRRELKVEERVTCIHGCLEQEIDKINSLNIHFDYILASGLLPQIEDQDDFMKKVASLCDKDTRVYVSVPNAQSIHRLLAKEMGLIQDVHEISEIGKKMQINTVYDMESLCQFMTKLGFDILERGTYFPKFLTTHQMEQIVKNGIVKEEIFSALYQIGENFPNNGSEIFVELKKQSGSMEV